jgi:hypothetical protein
MDNSNYKGGCSWRDNELWEYCQFGEECRCGRICAYFTKTKKLNKEISALLQWKPTIGKLKDHAKVNDPELLGYSSNDEKAPFFSEAYLYNLLGKEDARTLIALTRQALISLGADSTELQNRL